MKQFFVLSILLSASFQIVAQDTISVFINNIKAGQAIYKEGQKKNTIVLKKSAFKTYKSFVIQIKGEYVNGSEELEIIGDSTLLLRETMNKPGKFDITGTKSKQELIAGKTLKLYMVFDPSNTRIMRPSIRIYLCNIKAK